METDATVVEATPEAEEFWVAEILRMARGNLEFLESCTPGPNNNYGKPHEVAVQNSGWGEGAPAWEDVLQRWRDDGTFEGLSFIRK